MSLLELAHFWGQFCNQSQVKRMQTCRITIKPKPQNIRSWQKQKDTNPLTRLNRYCRRETASEAVSLHSCTKCVCVCVCVWKINMPDSLQCFTRLHSTPLESALKTARFHSIANITHVAFTSRMLQFSTLPSIT